jgi:TonB family protein
MERFGLLYLFVLASAGALNSSPQQFQLLSKPPLNSGISMRFCAVAVVQSQGEPLLRARSMEPLYRVDPEYPPVALRQGIQGTVRFEARIGEDGHVTHLRLISGHPLLVRAAREAARKWIYHPSILHGKPVGVVTTIDVDFRLGQDGRPPKKDNEPTKPGVARGVSLGSEGVHKGRPFASDVQVVQVLVTHLGAFQ